MLSVGIFDESSAADEAAIRAATVRYLHDWDELLAE